MNERRLPPHDVWRIFKTALLYQKPLCYHCQTETKASDVVHLDGAECLLEMQNAQTLCAECMRTRTKLDTTNTLLYVPTNQRNQRTRMRQGAEYR